jgi:phosphomannomutase/phosphoglucomutase
MTSATDSAAGRPVDPARPAPEISAGIFKAYDIRGIVDDTLTEEAVEAIGLALGARARAEGVASIVVGRDGRLSGPRLVAALSAGICAAGVDVLDIGMVPTPLVYFATVLTGSGTGVAVTGSHNPPEYNGLKMMIAGRTLYGDEITGIGTRSGTPQPGRSSAGPTPAPSPIVTCFRSTSQRSPATFTWRGR